MVDSDVARRILGTVLPYRRMAAHPGACGGDYCSTCAAAHLDRVAHHVSAEQPVRFILPAFPGKSPNSAKAFGPVPDRAEELALNFLNSLAEQIQDIHPPGARITICSDGRVFSDLVLIPDEHISLYQAELRTIISTFGYRHLELFNLDDVYPLMDHEPMRRALTERYAPPLATLRATVRDGGQALQLYRGITRFLYEDGLTPSFQGSKTALQRDCRLRAYGVIQRSQAWSNLLLEQFPTAVRLSIHPQPCGSPKLGIHLVETADTWLTPWHGVAAEQGGRYTLMKRREAEDRGGCITFSRGRPSHFHLPAHGSPSVSSHTLALGTPAEVGVCS
jgi:pyoverdine/dityrosine biosynthesis protein Dit1